jgi:hypothetical protein
VTDQKWRELWDGVYEQFKGEILTAEQADELYEWAGLKVGESEKDPLPPPGDLRPETRCGATVFSQPR